MNTRLKKQFDMIESRRKKLLDELKKYPDELLNKKPLPEAWSAIQVMEHLMISEEASLKYLQKKTLDTSRAAPAGFKSASKLFLLNLSFFMPVKYKAPAVLNPSEGFISLKEIESKWTKIREDIFQLTDSLNDAELKKELWKHAFAGKMNIYQMLDFFNTHFERHRKQIEREMSDVRCKYKDG